MNEIAALLTSFTHLQNIAKAMFNLRDFEKLNATVMELQSAIITAQQNTIDVQRAYFALETKTRDLEAECMRLKDWSAEKEQYVSREIATGVFAYVHKDTVGSFQHAHKLCCNCFNEGQKSVLQQVIPSMSNQINLICPRCGFKTTFWRYKESGGPIIGATR